MDDASGWCRGCGRTEEEIGEWALAGDARRMAIWALLPARADALGINITRLPWRRGRIAEFAADSLYNKTGIWTLGSDGAFAEILCSDNAPCEISISEDTISALTRRGGLKLTIDDNVRALKLWKGEPEGGAILLVALKAKTNLPVATGLTPLGPDTGALKPECRNDLWFDVGLGRRDLQFCLRTAEPKLADVLTRSADLALSELLRIAGPMIRDHNPTRVFVSPLGRAEMFSLAPPHGEILDERSVTSVQITAARLEAACHDLPPIFTLGATFHPRASAKGGDMPRPLRQLS